MSCFRYYSLEDSAEFHEYMPHLGLDFPVLYDPTACIEKNLMLPDTPCKVLINREGEILLTDYVRQDDKSKANILVT